ncbi:hypothetical protein [Nannocystis punicea]|uniref:Tetratricopeptide repeat-containing protein n=1 Tax=Nannocystis punicea TaxID=2995304 RepID=A0ABY7H6B4_9BACT|nr:hypothetical protein [Nannocystis poenicansa]WAS94524.1 hypothetical protein O0S08_00040 [Nannocystis poenicansa]
MLPILAELESLLAAFVERDLPGVLVVACTDVESLHIAQLLAHLDERSESDLFLNFTDPACTVAEFVDCVARNLQLQQAALVEQLGSSATLPPLPARAHERGSPLVVRMQALLDHALRLLPPGDHRLVWSLCPTELPRDFSTELAVPLLRMPHDARLRLVLRDDRTAPMSFKLAESWPDEHVLAYSLDFPAEGAVAATAAAAQDAERPIEARVQALMELAYLDLGHGRLGDADQKFRGCAQFYALRRDPPLQALALAGAADIQRARGDMAGARLTYETALLAVASDLAFPVTLQIAVDLADTCFSLNQFTDAEGYYRLADAIAGKLLRPHTKADVQESIGACRLVQGAGDEAVQIWNAATELCRAIDYPKRFRSVLGRLEHARRGICLEAPAAIRPPRQETRPC